MAELKPGAALFGSLFYQKNAFSHQVKPYHIKWNSNQMHQEIETLSI